MGGPYYFDDAKVMPFVDETYDGTYSFVIRDHRRPNNWVFRFGGLDRGHAGEVLRNLNYPKAVKT